MMAVSQKPQLIRKLLLYRDGDCHIAISYGIRIATVVQRWRLLYCRRRLTLKGQLEISNGGYLTGGEPGLFSFQIWFQKSQKKNQGKLSKSNPCLKSRLSMMVSLVHNRQINSFSSACLDQCSYPLRSDRSCIALCETSQSSCDVAFLPGEGPRPLLIFRPN